MCPFTFKDKTCADPAIWQSWIDCCKKTNDKSFLKSEQILSALVLFLKENESKYAKYVGGLIMTLDNEGALKLIKFSFEITKIFKTHKLLKQIYSKAIVKDTWEVIG